jgi:LmbE family N-acetylglucosaminyl deacetylase
MMLAKAMRTRAQEFLRSLQRELAVPLTEEELAVPALVFAPHPDDETLGCGGTILRKRRLGADVRIVFMTDGANSHTHLMAADELRAVRAAEAAAAAAVLGVAQDALEFLAFADGNLAGQAPLALDRVATLLSRHKPQQVFLPYPRGEHPDHVATHSIVHQALGRSGGATVLEYPVWFWRHWPWTPLAGRDAPDLLRASFDASFGLRLCQEMRATVDIRDVLADKRAALAEHRSQTRRRRGDPRWWILGDVSGGAFLACFFQNQEVFRRSGPAITRRPP